MLKETPRVLTAHPENPWFKVVNFISPSYRAKKLCPLDAFHYFQLSSFKEIVSSILRKIFGEIFSKSNLVSTTECH